MVNPSLAIGVIGAGSWGTALSLLLAGKGHRVDLWVYEKDLCAIMNQERENRVYLPGFQLLDTIHPSSSLQEVVANKKIILVVVPTHVLRSTLNSVKAYIDPECLIINASKGIENESLLPIHKVIEEMLPAFGSLAVLSGLLSPRKSHREIRRPLSRRRKNRKPPNACKTCSIPIN